MDQIIKVASIFLFLSVTQVFGEGTQSRRSELKPQDFAIKQIDDSIRILHVRRGFELESITKNVKAKKSVDSSMVKDIDLKIEKLQTKKQILAESQGNAFDVQQDLLSIAVLIFGLLIIFAILIFQARGGFGLTYSTFKLIGVILIGTVSVFLIPSGFDDAQITPIVGLLGTLAGYLIGSQQQKKA